MHVPMLFANINLASLATHGGCLAHLSHLRQGFLRIRRVRSVPVVVLALPSLLVARLVSTIRKEVRLVARSSAVAPAFALVAAVAPSAIL